LSITIDGIEGLQFGNIITIDYLPDIYRKNSAFAITSISHDISKEGWTTAIDTQFRIKSVRIEEPPTPKVISKEEQDRRSVEAIDGVNPDEFDGPETELLFPDGNLGNEFE
jgi:hypothetical protein